MISESHDHGMIVVMEIVQKSPGFFGCAMMLCLYCVRSSVEQFIRNKYIKKSWASKDPVNGEGKKAVNKQTSPVKVSLNMLCFEMYVRMYVHLYNLTC